MINKIVDYQELLEYFDIISRTPMSNYRKALQSACNETTPELAARLQKQITEEINIFINDCTAKIKQAKAAGNDIKEILETWRLELPCDIYDDILKAIKSADPAEGHANFETLSKYIDAGFELYPCVYSKQQKNYLHINLNGKFKLYETEEKRQAKDRHGITDKALLQELCNQTKTIKGHAITLFRIFPIDNKYIVIDIDTHEGHANGLIQWQDYIKSKNLNTGYYKDLQQFPCYTESANGGKHLYFKIPYDIPPKIINLASSVEVCTKDHPETAAGSFRTGTKNKYYVLHGSFENAPILPMQIYKDIQPKPEPPAMPIKQINKAAGTKAKWNTTSDGIIEKARQKHGNETPHNFAYWTCKYFNKANQEGGNFSKAEIESVVFALPELARHDRNDTRGVINSFNFI